MWRPPPHASLLRPILRRFLPSSPSSPPHPPLLTAAARSLSSHFTSAASEASDDLSDLARSISAELVKLSTATDPCSSSSSSHLDLPRHFSLHFSDVRFNTPLLHRVLDFSPTAGRAAIDLYRWIVRHRSFTPKEVFYLIGELRPHFPHSICFQQHHSIFRLRSSF
ncbi:putative pentatricopeptide repeat-containing protein PNM1, mitochondrial [Cocos nucifera]|nr:putative pentatricopeptide repeat-containing protein PNM1, mitochondrial [Cocos nucifera]